MSVNYETFIPYPLQVEFMNHPARYKLFAGGVGSGKCQKIGTKVLMYDGTLKEIQDIVIGDLVMGIDSTPRRVLATSSGEDEMYEIHQNIAMSYTVNSAHILSLKKGIAAKKENRYKDVKDVLNINVLDFNNKSKRFKENFYGYKAGLINFKEQDLLLEPYFLGIWLGDGSSRTPSITTPDKEVIDYIYKYANELEIDIRISKQKTTDCKTYNLTNNNNNNKLTQILRELNVLENKHIPKVYLSNSEKNRLELLAGLLDSDGYYHCGCFEFSSKRIELAKQTKFLADMLGFKTSFKVKKVKVKEGDVRDYYIVSISGDTNRIPTKIKRKQATKLNKNKDWLVSSISKIEHVGRDKYFGISIDKDCLYILEDGTVTHNSMSVVAEGIRLSLDYPGNCGYIARHHYKDFKRSTLETIMEMVPNKIIESFNKQDGIMKLVNGSTILMGDLEYPDKIKSMNLGWFGIDEASETTKAMFDILKTRLRKNLKGIKYYGLLASNPEPCWLKDIFIDPQNAGKTLPDHIYIQSLPRDNPHLPKDYVENLIRDLPPLMRKKYVEGCWDIHDTQVINKEWIKHNPLPDIFKFTVIYVDPAISEQEASDESVITVLGVDGFDDIYEREIIAGRWSFQGLIDKCVDAYTKYKPDVYGVEINAFQKALSDVLIGMGMPIECVRNDTDKLRRVISISDLFEQGKVNLYDEALIKQAIEFPKSTKDDRIDSCTGALRLIKNSYIEKTVKAKDKYSHLTPNEKLFWKQLNKDEEEYNLIVSPWD